MNNSVNTTHLKHTGFTLNINSAHVLYVIYFFAFICVALSLLLGYLNTTQSFILPIGSAIIAQYTALSACMVLAWYISPNRLTRFQIQGFLAIAILLRVIVFFVEPYTSNDIDRYLFDGKIALEGLDPYRIPHNDPALATLKALWQPPAEHEKYVTLYPPGAIALFALAATAGPEWSMWFWKALVCMGSILTVFIGYKLLDKLDNLKALPFITLSPILVLDMGEAAHLDMFVVLCLAFILLFWLKNNFLLAGIFIGIGVLIKLSPGILLLPLFFLAPAFKQKAQLALATALTILCGYAISLIVGLIPFGSIDTFFIKWRSASFIFETLNYFLTGLSLTYTLVTIALIGCLIIGFKAYRAQSAYLSSHNIGLIQATLALPLLVSPVIFPWYLAPLCFLVALRPSIFLIAWAITLPFVYEVLSAFLCCNYWQNAQWPIILIGSVLSFITLTCLYRLMTNKSTQFLVKTNNNGGNLWLM